MKVSGLITDFLEYMEIEQNRSQKTIANYHHYLTRLADFAGDIEVNEITAELIRKWRLWLNRLGTNTSDELQKSTQNYHLIALRSFLKFCAKRGIDALPAEPTPVYRSPAATGATLLSTSYTVTAGQITAVSPRLRGLLALKTVTARFGSGVPVVCTPGVFTVLDVLTGLREQSYDCVGLLEDADRPRPLRITAS